MKPDTIYLVVDTDHTEAADLHDAHGDTIHDVPVVAERVLDGSAHCEACDTDDDGYILADQSERHGVPVCLPCLLGYEWVRAVVSDIDELRKFQADDGHVTVSYETAIEAERELRFLIEHSDAVSENGEAMTPLARAKARVEERAEHAVTSEVAAGMRSAASVIETVGEETGEETSPVDPLTDAIFRAHSELESAVK